MFKEIKRPVIGLLAITTFATSAAILGSSAETPKCESLKLIAKNAALCLHNNQYQLITKDDKNQDFIY